ncbi:hypothetical protein AB0D98_29930 [Streptomyces sp. NPDC047987]|uniref:hypothetical protein n=1 Tax=unclassified Streptomyces TaxID=2593676 RepID=UPI00341550C0
MNANGVPEAVVVGHSLGGLLAVEYARAYAARARPRPGPPRTWTASGGGGR